MLRLVGHDQIVGLEIVVLEQVLLTKRGQENKQDLSQKGAHLSMEQIREDVLVDQNQKSSQAISNAETGYLEVNLLAVSELVKRYIRNRGQYWYTVS